MRAGKAPSLEAERSPEEPGLAPHSSAEPLARLLAFFLFIYFFLFFFFSFFPFLLQLEATRCSVLVL